jgi:UDP-N-acetylmuramate dehydrogenase
VEFLEDVPLAPFTTLGIGGPARWFATARTQDDVAEAVLFATEHALPLFVLGGGSNLLVADAGFPGLVLHMGIRGRDLSEHDSLLRAGAGEDWDDLVQFAAERNLSGVECLAGIPGTVGGTPVQNVGAYGQEVAETIRTVRCFDIQTSRFVELPNEACEFAYRTSVFNTRERGRYIVTRVDFALTRDGAPKLTYADLRKQFSFGESPTLHATADAVRAIRRTKSMVVEASDPNSRSAGSFFQNPVVDARVLAQVSQAAEVEAASIPNWPVGENHIKLPAAWLLERAGFVRGYIMGRAGISTNHTLALINRGGCTAAEMESLRDRIVVTVHRLFGITLLQEPVNVR